MSEQEDRQSSAPPQTSANQSSHNEPEDKDRKSEPQSTAREQTDARAEDEQTGAGTGARAGEYS